MFPPALLQFAGIARLPAFTIAIGIGQFPPPPPPSEVEKGPAYHRPVGGRSRDDWLRCRRDRRNSAHSPYPLRLPLSVAWSAPLPSWEVRVWRNVVLLPRRSSLVALDLRTGKERWRRARVSSLGDLTGDGRATFTNDNDLLALDVRTGRTLWTQSLTQPPSKPSVHNGIIYLKEGSILQRFRLSDGRRLSPGAEIESWGLPVFTQDRLLIATSIWLYNLSRSDPARGTKFYNGGSSAILLEPYVVTEGWYWRGQAFRIDGDRLHKVWDKRTGRDVAHCWVPYGKAGAILLHHLPNRGPDRLTLFDLPTGSALWTSGETPDSLAVTAGHQILLRAVTKRKILSEDGSVHKRRTFALKALHAHTGRTLWSGPAEWGKPLAATNGRLLTASDTHIYCLR